MPKDFRLTLAGDGFGIAGQSYNHHPINTSGRTHRLLLLHGNMDNCRSYHLLAPALLEHYQQNKNYSTDNCEIVAIDLPSHGQSDWRPQATVVVVDYVVLLARIIAALEWDNSNCPPITIIAHSMACSIASAYAAAFSKHVEKLIMLEGTGPMQRDNPMELPQQIQAHVQACLQQQKDTTASATATAALIKYESIEQLIKVRQLTPQQAPGNQYISYQAARELVLWGAKEIKDGTWQWRLDPKLHIPHLMYLSCEQMVAILQAITCPVCVLVAKEGWPIQDQNMYDTLMAALQPVVHQTLPGSHAFHADPEHAPAVINAVIEFLDAQHDKPIRKVAPHQTANAPRSAPPPSNDAAAAGCCAIL